MANIKFPIAICLFVAAALTACQPRLEQRAAQLCAYIPNPEQLERSRGFLTDEFYAILDTMCHYLPAHEAMDHQYNYWFVSDDGSPLAECPCEVLSVQQIDADHAEATISEDHQMLLERVNGQWLMADFDGHKADAIRYIAINREEQAVRDAISAYLLQEIAPYYLQGELCVPTLMIVHETDSCVWGDFWVFWYNQSGDTLQIVSGGSHPGKMTLRYDNGQPQVTRFEPVEDGARFLPTAKRIFGEYFDLFMAMHSNESVREAVRQEQLEDYFRQRDLRPKL